MNWKDVFPKENRYYETKNGILYLGDSFNILKKFPEKSIDLIIADPPYDVSVTNRGGSINNIKKYRDSLLDVSYDDIHKGYNVNLFLEIIKPLQKKLNLYIWSNKKYIPIYFKKILTLKKYLFDILFWYKQNAIPSYSNKYLTDTEYLLYFKESGAYNQPQNYEDAKTLFLDYINHKDKKTYGHPTIKPLEIHRKIIRNSSKEGNIILDPFVGSGTTLVAAELEGRRWIGIEIMEKYCKLSIKRLKEIKQNLFKKI